MSTKKIFNFREDFLRKFKDIELLKDTFRVIDAVRENGDQEILSYYKKKCIERESVRISNTEIKEAVELVGKPGMEVLRTLHKQMMVLAEKEKKAHLDRKILNEDDSFQSVLLNKPFGVVGIYIPRNLPSSLIFYCQLAKTAGVENISLAVPPNLNGSVNPYLLAAASVVGVDDIIAVGGRRAFPALAFGLAGNVPDKLFGPCSLYVDHVKQVLSTFYKVPIDISSGPSELLVFVDNEYEIGQVELDVRAQMEHGPDSRCFIVSTQERILDQVKEVTEDIQDQIQFIHAVKEKEAIDIINEVAPEILEIFSLNPQVIIDGLKSIANVYVNVCSPMGDYYVFGKGCADPTYGMARGMSGITIESFYKTACVTTFKGRGKSNEKYDWVPSVPEIEGFRYHKSAIQRFLTNKMEIAKREK